MPLLAHVIRDIHFSESKKYSLLNLINVVCFDIREVFLDFLA